MGRVPQHVISILDTLIDSYWELELPSGTIKHVTGTNSTLGYDAESFPPDFDSLRALVHPDHLSYLDTHFTDFLNGKQRYFQQEFRIKAKGGAYVWVLSRAIIAERNDYGQPSRVIGIHIDITDRRLLEQALRETTDAYQALFDNNPFGVSLSRMSGEYFDVNEKFAQFLGLDRSEIVGKKPEDFGVVLELDKEAVISALIQNGLAEGQHVRVRRGANQHTLHLVLTSQVTAVAGEPMVLSVLNDVTNLVNVEVERALMKEKLRQNEVMLRTVLDTIPVRVFWKDRELRFLGCNKAFANDAGFDTPDELIGRNDFDMVWREQAKLYRADDLDVLNTGVMKMGVEEPQTTPAGDTIWLRTTKTAFRDADGKVTGVLGTYENITENRSFKERLAKAEKMQALGLMAGGVAHDLNNMLSPLVGYPALMLHKLPPDSPLIDTVRRIERAAVNATEMVEDLLTLARRGRYQLEPLSLNEVITDYMDSPHYRRTASEKPGIRIRIELSESLPLITGSKVHINKLIMNVVGNAFDATEEPGEIHIRSSLVELSHLRSGFNEVTPGTYATVSIKDTGHGIAVEDRQKIFEPYFSRKQMGKSGSGLGLAVVYGVVKDHNGYYDVFSEVGCGTEFVFYFPLKGTLHCSEGDNAEHRTNRRILVVDDSAIAREQTMEMLCAMGHSAASVPTGHEALKYLSNHAVDLVVLDMLMEPGFDGLDTYREILKVRPEQNVIVVSGYMESDRAQELLKAGASALLAKPLTRDALYTAVQHAIGASNRS